MPRRSAIPCAALFVSACAAAVVAVLMTAAQDLDYLYRDLVVDDAIYYVQPAQNLWAGRGYSFDGVHRTNGVQPLWAMFVVLMTGALGDPGSVVRAMVLVGGLLWIAGSAQLYRLLVGLHPLGALLGAGALLMAGMEGRMATRGMEAGLHCFLLVQALAQARGVARTAADDPARRRRLRRLGVVAALLALTRIEYGLFAALLGCWLALDGNAGGAAARMRAAIAYAAPVVALGATWLLFSKLYFDEWTPVSGSVKAFVSARETRPFAERLAIVGLDSGVRAGAAEAWAVLVALFWAFGRIATFPEALSYCLAVLSPIALAARSLARRLLRAAPARTIGVAGAFSAFLAVHVVLMAIVLVPYIGYCGWYMTGETVAWCLLAGGLAGALRGWWRLLAAPTVALLALTYALRVGEWYRFAPTSVTAPFVELGRWADEWLPENATIGCFASGYVALEARRHRVVNLDGLINDGRYLREYVMKERVPDYFRDERIGYFVDNLPAAAWRKYLRHDVHELPAGLEPLLCRPSVQGTVVAAFATGLGDPALPRAAPQPMAAAYLRALVHELDGYRFVRAGELAALPADAVIAGAAVLESYDVRYAVLPEQALAGAVDVAGLAQLLQVDRTFGERVTLRAVEPPFRRVTTERPFALTGYWQAEPGIADAGALRLCLEIAGRTLVEPPAAGTLSPGAWAPGVVLPHTFVVTLPADAPEQVTWRMYAAGPDGVELPARGGAAGAFQLGAGKR